MSAGLFVSGFSDSGESVMSLVSGSGRPPVGEEEFMDWFDSDGRLVKEASMRRAVFEAAVVPQCRRSLWKFLFGLYPMHSTYRERKIIDIENRSHYQALRERWEVLDKTVFLPDDDLVQSPPYMAQSDGESEGEEDKCSFLSSEHRIKNTSTVGTSSSGKRNSEPSLCGQLGGREASRTKSEPSNGTSGRRQQSAPVSRDKSMSLNTGRDNYPETVGGAVKESRISELESSGNGDSALGSSRPSDQPFSDSSDFDTCSSSTGCDVAPPVVRTLISSTSSNSTAMVNGDEDVCQCDFKRHSYNEVLDDEGQSLLRILEFPSRVFATRQPVDLEKAYPKAKRIVLRDVMRTDRNYHYFSHKRNLRKVHRILMVYALFHPDISYCQGMNDLLARFLVVTESEVDSYWLFVKYMDQKRVDFLEDTMLFKVGHVKKLLREVDEELCEFFDRSECHDYLFCHRWLLLDFKREFSFEDGIRIFEVLSSHYLELNSDQALKETDRAIAEEFEQDGGELRAGRAAMNLDFTFDLFVCVAILILHKQEVCQSMDAASVYGCLNGLSMNMNCSVVLRKAEELFYQYCRLSVSRGFNEITL